MLEFILFKFLIPLYFKNFQGKLLLNVLKVCLGYTLKFGFIFCALLSWMHLINFQIFLYSQQDIHLNLFECFWEFILLNILKYLKVHIYLFLLNSFLNYFVNQSKIIFNNNFFSSYILQSVLKNFYLKNVDWIYFI